MGKIFLFFCLIAVASATNSGYDYLGSEPKAAPSVHTAQTHDDGYKKQYYYFNAPEEHIEHAKPVQQITTHTKKNLQVIFIKPPVEKVHKKPVQHVAQNVVEEKTHIYVLTKEPNHAPVKKNVQTIQHAAVHHHKPEVHFVKYHTPEDAHHIQQSIIQQYGGKPSEIVHSGSAPIVNFATTSNKGHHHSSPSREYLAPASTSVVV